jgi:uncharacterized protein
MNTAPNRTKRIVITITGLLLIAFVVVNVFAYQHAYSMMNFSEHAQARIKLEEMSLGQKLKTLFVGANPSRPSASVSPSALGDQCQSVQISEQGAPSIGAWYCPAEDNQHLAILFHGYLMNKSSLIEEARVFLQAGYAVLLVDFRGSWESSEAYTTIGYFEADDVAAATRYAHQHFPHKKLVLYGQSMGGAAILRAVHSHAVNADAIIVEAVFDRLLNTVKNRFHVLGVPAFPGAHVLVFWGGWQTGFNGFTHNPVDYAQAVNVPILFLHGDSDNRAKLQDAYSVYESVPALKHFSVFPDTVHESHLARHPEIWKKEIIGFLALHL